MRHAASLFLATLAPLGALHAEIPAFVPLPAQVVAGDGRFKITAETGIVAPATLAGEADYLAKHLRRVAGVPAEVNGATRGVTLSVDSSLPAEGYTLEITPAGVTIKGGSPSGVFYGVITFMQALPAPVFGSESVSKADWSAPALKVSDAPACAWRGLHLDSARHFQPKAFILKFLDAMAAQKLNRFHWHLVDSEGWRLEIKKYPKLAHVTDDAPAYFPEEIPTNPTFRAKYRYGHFHGGGFYTQDDVREIVAYAAARHITVIPEIEFPGHAMAMLNAYPEFATNRKAPTVRSNISGELVGTHPEAVAFLKDVLDETMDLFPGRWIHFGGDEAPKGNWKQDAETQKRIDALGLRVPGSEKDTRSEDMLQAWLFNELSAHVAKRGKAAVGWEEIMHGDNLTKLSKDVVVMPWLSRNNAVKSANAGHGVVFTSVGPFYLDSYQVNAPGEPSALYGGPFTAEAIRNYDLIPGGLTEAGRKNVYGAQCQLWSELMPRTDDVEYQAFPRACALAELTWTAQDRRRATEDGFMERLALHGERLTALGLNHRRVPRSSNVPAWTPGLLGPGAKWEFPVPADLASRLSRGGKLSVGFNYKSGEHGVDIAAVELLANGKPVVNDTHAGFAGGQSRANTYVLSVPAGTRGTLTVRVKAAGSGGTDSRGDVSLGVAP